jgi:DUF1009 family protein
VPAEERRLNRPAAKSDTRLGLIAGGGGLPIQAARACVEAGRPLFVVRLKGFADPEMAEYPGMDAGLGEFGKVFSALKREHCEVVCFAGAVKRPDFSALKPDLRGLTAMPGLMAAARRGDDAVLRRVLWEFEREGFAIEGVHAAVSGMTMSEGPMGRLRPEARHAEDITRALQVARGIGELDIGQGAVVVDGLVLAVEAQEGTDEMLRRVSSLPAAIRGSVEARVGVLAKAPKPIQDRRVDLPTIGVTTIRNAAAAGLAGVAGEASGVLMVDREDTIAEADKLGLFIYGSPPTQRY